MLAARALSLLEMLTGKILYDIELIHIRTKNDSAAHLRYSEALDSMHLWA